ncbi:MAG TPA: hypothetical protein VGW34_13565 [Allosphingosinicella sp.]|nr:hypothetical protein [Allosphingosinicella sp.]
MRFPVWPLLSLAACAPADDNPLLADDITVVVDAPGEPPRPAYSGPAYFPPSLGEPTLRCDLGDPARLQPILSDLERDWYSRQLAAAGEPPLYPASQAARPAGAATLRFTWLRSFHAPIVVRIETSGPNTHRLIAKQLSGAGGYDPGKVAKKIERPLTAAEAKRLRAALESRSVFEIPPDPCGGGCDGAQWIFEAAEGRRYRFVDLWTPDSGPAHDLGRFLVGLTGWKIEAIY